MAAGAKRILYLVAEDWFFCSHFIERALAARAAGYDVVVAARDNGQGREIERSGLRFLPISLRRRGLNPLGEIRAFLEILRIYRYVRPDLVHHVALKPILYGSLAARLCGIPCTVNAPVGMGYVFVSAGWLARLLKPVVRQALRVLLNPAHGRVVVENRDDLEGLVAEGMVRPQDGVLIRGAGVDLDQYLPSAEPAGVPVVVLPARMLWDKGVGEFVQAATRLRSEGIQARFLLAGAPDPGNPASIEDKVLRAWDEAGYVEWLGHRTDMPELLTSSHIVCLPSYREGLPKALIEALAAGRPVVTTDVPGCREVVEQGRNGLMVPPRDPGALAEALKRLILDPELRGNFGREGRRMAEAAFGSRQVIAATMAVYGDLLASSGRPAC